MAVHDDDKFIVNRGGTDYKVSASEIDDKLQNDDQVLINRGGTDYKVSGMDLKKYLDILIPSLPWDGHDGGIFHIKNVQGSALELAKLPSATVAWDVDGTNPREIDSVAVGEELVFICDKDCGRLFERNRGTWDFGEHTNTSNVRSMELIFTSATSFNSDISGWDTSNVEDMTELFSGARSFNSDISGWDTSNVENMSRMFDGAVVFNQDLSGWCVRKISTKPDAFDLLSGFEGQTAKQPQWGTCPRGEDQP